MHETWMVYSTVKTKEEAIFIAHTLLQERLVACVNLHKNVESLYIWQGQLQHENEVLLLAKTGSQMVQAVIDRIKALHSYEVPCILAFAANKGFPPFLDWVDAQTQPTPHLPVE